jgi:hypothetical protein
MAIMLEEIKVLIEFVELPDVFGRTPTDYPTESIPELGPFSYPDKYEVRCSTTVMEFYWASELVGTVPQNSCEWPDQMLPCFMPCFANNSDGSNYFYYATGKCFYIRYTPNDIIYCYPIQRLEINKK